MTSDFSRSIIFKRIYLNEGPTCLARLGGKHVPAHWASSQQLFTHHCLKRTLFQISALSILDKGYSHWAIVKTSNANAMFSDCVIFLNDIPIPLSKLKICCNSSNGKFGATTTYSSDSASILCSKHLYGTGFSSNCDVKTAAENFGLDFYHDGLSM
ncbi:hypothetical protein AVEN_246057-1 [Araneus ventricosus]|uniref:Uncharacterized protein n=1 Tax=Araneus ventricosus TaxID=182803 RepID=A0A4Y2SGA7_ARAVE|nr:hypothetical protein AVEN_246057-1 [Araneus ventricosus]